MSQRYADWVPKPDRAALESLIAADVRALTAESDQIGRHFAGRHDWPPTTFARYCTSWSRRRGISAHRGRARARMGMSGAAITYLVERMIASGHFRRESDPADRRKVILRVADDGIAVARGFFTPLAEHNQRATGRVARRGPRRRTPHLRRAHRRDAGVPRPTGRLVTMSMSSSAATAAPSVRIQPRRVDRPCARCRRQRHVEARPYSDSTVGVEPSCAAPIPRSATRRAQYGWSAIWGTTT